MNVLILENTARPLETKDRVGLLRLLKGHRVKTVKLPKKRVRGPYKKLLDTDLIIAVGGDGSVLSAAHYAWRTGVPILGFNTGHVGFLAGITPATYRTELPHILAQRYTIESRMALCLKLPSGREGWGLNDLGFQTTGRTLFSAELLLNGQKICDYKGDGLIVSTATGSTAYNLSLGGPLLAPDSGMVAVTPKAPLTLTNRTLVLNNPEVLAFRITGGPTRIDADSNPVGTVNSGEVVYIHRSPVTVPIVFPANHNHYTAVGEKLRWNEALISR